MCAFEVDFYNYGAGDFNADVNFAMHSPTRYDGPGVNGNTNPYIGGDRPGGGTDIDAQEEYTLDFSGAAHPKQGYHVKLTIHAPYSQGADVKHKVFWVKPCDDEVPGNPDDEVPGNPDDEVPGKPDDEVPGKPDDEVPGNPDDEVPGNPDDEVPGNPDDDVPGNPDDDVPPEEGAALPGGVTPPGQSPTDVITRVVRVPGAQAGAGAGAAAGAGAGAPAGVGEAAGQAPGAAAGPSAEAGAPAAVPTAVEAGLTGQEGRQDWVGAATATSLLGLCGLLAIAVALAAYRRRGDYQA